MSYQFLRLDHQTSQYIVRLPNDLKVKWVITDLIAWKGKLGMNVKCKGRIFRHKSIQSLWCTGKGKSIHVKHGKPQLLWNLPIHRRAMWNTQRGQVPRPIVYVPGPHNSVANQTLPLTTTVIAYRFCLLNAAIWLLVHTTRHSSSSWQPFCSGLASVPKIESDRILLNTWPFIFTRFIFLPQIITHTKLLNNIFHYLNNIN